jgi:hypothetical protein
MKLNRSSAMPVFGALVLSLLLSSSLRAANLEGMRYEAWAKFKVGSSHTLSGTVDAGQMQIPSEITQKLIDVKPDHVTIEMSSKVTIMGREHVGKPQQRDIPVKDKDVQAKDLGEETVEAMGRTFQCHVYEVNGKDAAPPPPGPGGRPAPADDERFAKVWVSPEVPGGLVKMEIKGRRPQGQDMTVTYLLKSFEAK